MTKKEKIFWLQTLLEMESEKPINKKDIKKINRYKEELLKLQGKNGDLTPEEVAERVAKIPFVE